MPATRRFDSLDDWLGYFASLHPKQIDMSLDRVHAVLARLGLTHPPYRVVTVGGTNGKGSCVAMLASVYRAAGFRTGAFTSPHLVRFNERIASDGRDVDDAALVELFTLIDEALGELTLSYFEASAVAAMLHFARVQTDIAVLEVGMGGRLDAVNALDADASLIVSIDLDHMDYLGPDRDAIGFEKAGIARAGRPVIVADADPPGGLLDALAAKRADQRLIGRDFSVRACGDRFAFESTGCARREFPLPAFGTGVQLTNAGAVVATVDAMQPLFPVRDDAIAAGIASAHLRGRFDRQVVEGVEWIFDVAHNPAAASAFARALDALAPVAGTHAVFGAMHDKDLEAVLQPFLPRVSGWFVGGIDSDRGEVPERLAAILDGLGAAAVSVHADVGAAASAAKAAGADRILVFGSFYTVGPAMQTVGIY